MPSAGSTRWSTRARRHQGKRSSIRCDALAARPGVEHDADVFEDIEAHEEVDGNWRITTLRFDEIAPTSRTRSNDERRRDDVGREGRDP